jgi:hypothetical protein
MALIFIKSLTHHSRRAGDLAHRRSLGKGKQKLRREDKTFTAALMFGSSLFIPTQPKTCVCSPFHTEKMPFSRCQPFLSLQISASLSRDGLRMCFRSLPLTSVNRAARGSPMLKLNRSANKTSNSFPGPPTYASVSNRVDDVALHGALFSACWADGGPMQLSGRAHASTYTSPASALSFPVLHRHHRPQLIPTAHYSFLVRTKLPLQEEVRVHLSEAVASPGTLHSTDRRKKRGRSRHESRTRFRHKSAFNRTAKEGKHKSRECAMSLRESFPHTPSGMRCSFALLLTFHERRHVSSTHLSLTIGAK